MTTTVTLINNGIKETKEFDSVLIRNGFIECSNLKGSPGINTPIAYSIAYVFSIQEHNSGKRAEEPVTS